MSARQTAPATSESLSAESNPPPLAHAKIGDTTPNAIASHATSRSIGLLRSISMSLRPTFDRERPLAIGLSVHQRRPFRGHCETLAQVRGNSRWLGGADP